MANDPRLPAGSALRIEIWPRSKSTCSQRSPSASLRPVGQIVEPHPDILYGHCSDDPPYDSLRRFRVNELMGACLMGGAVRNWESTLHALP